MREYAKFRVLTFPILLLFLTGCFFQGKSRRPVKYLIPAEYVGWVKIEFEVKGEPELPVEDGFVVCRFPKTGVLKTSSPIEYGVAVDEYYYYSGEVLQRLSLPAGGADRLIWGEFNGREFDSNNRLVGTHEQFFVGEEVRYRENARPGETKPGPIEP